MRVVEKRTLAFFAMVQPSRRWRVTPARNTDFLDALGDRGIREINRSHSMKREYPFTAWILGGTFIPKQIEFVKKGWGADWHCAKSGKQYLGEEVFASKEEAISAGREKLAQQEAKIKKQQEVIAKKRANLDKHS